MSWVCKKCGREVVEIAVIPTTIIRNIKKDGKGGKIVAEQKHKIEHSKEFTCIYCKEKASATYKDSLKIIAKWEDKK